MAHFYNSTSEKKSKKDICPSIGKLKIQDNHLDEVTGRQEIPGISHDENKYEGTLNDTKNMEHKLSNTKKDTPPKKPAVLQKLNPQLKHRREIKGSASVRRSSTETNIRIRDQATKRENMTLLKREFFSGTSHAKNTYEEKLSVTKNMEKKLSNIPTEDISIIKETAFEKVILHSNHGREIKRTASVRRSSIETNRGKPDQVTERESTMLLKCVFWTGTSHAKNTFAEKLSVTKNMEKKLSNHPTEDISIIKETALEKVILHSNHGREIKGSASVWRSSIETNRGKQDQVTERQNTMLLKREFCTDISHAKNTYAENLSVIKNMEKKLSNPTENISATKETVLEKVNLRSNHGREIKGTASVRRSSSETNRRKPDQVTERKNTMLLKREFCTGTSHAINTYAENLSDTKNMKKKLSNPTGYIPSIKETVLENVNPQLNHGKEIKRTASVWRSSREINRRKQERVIERENMILLKRIQNIKAFGLSKPKK